ncbi:MAG: PAS domain S-box protein [Desulfobacteraceae bacterium]|nr:PAS domain S-box protein [Desulfobacteraceae bacterium]
MQPTHEELKEQLAALSKESSKLKQQEQAVQRRNEYLTALHETSLGLIDKLDKKELLETILERAASLIGTAHGYIYLLEPGDTLMQMKYGMGFFAGQLGRHVARGQGMGGLVWERGQPVLVDDYRTWEHRLLDKSLDGLHSIVGIPMQSEQKFMGVIGLAHVQMEGRFTTEDVAMLERFAALALIALEKARLYTELRRELAGHRRTSMSLKESEKRHARLLESSPDPIVVYSIEGEATYVNPAFEQTLGWSRAEILGGKIDFVPQENWPETRDAIRQMLSGKKIQLFETRRLTKDGRVLDVQLSSTLFEGHDGKPAGNIVILRDITARKRAERELQRYHEKLEKRVKARTEALEKSNQRLEQEILEKQRAEEAQRHSRAQLAAQSKHLEEVNTALKVLLKQRESDKSELAENVLHNVRELVMPYLDRIKKQRLKTDQTTLVQILETNLNNIVSPFISKLSSKNFRLTPMEIKVANLIRAGKTSREIADLLFLSKNTVLFHRANIRRKLGLKNAKVNLSTHLLSFDE